MHEHKLKKHRLLSQLEKLPPYGRFFFAEIHLKKFAEIYLEIFAKAEPGGDLLLNDDTNPAAAAAPIFPPHLLLLLLFCS